MREYLNAEIDKRTAAIGQREDEKRVIDQQIEVLAAERGVLNEILAKLDETQIPERSAASGMASRTSRGTGEDRPGKKSRLSPRWMPVLTEAVTRYPEYVKNEEVPEIQRSAGVDPADANGVRSHVWTQSQTGLYEKRGAGEFRATKVAANAIGRSLGYTDDAVQTEGELQESKAPNSSELSGTPKTNGARPLNL